MSSALANEFLNLLFQVGAPYLMSSDVKIELFINPCVFVLIQVCHIVLGLRPGTPEEEGQIIRYDAVFLYLFYSIHC